MNFQERHAECYLRTSHLGGAHLWTFEVEAEVEDLTGSRGPAALADLLGLEDGAVDAWAAEGCHSVWEILESDPKIVEALEGRWIRYEEPDVAPDGGALSTSCETWRFFGGACLLGRPA